MFADFVGYFTLLVVVSIAAFAASSDCSEYLMAGFIYLVLALMGHYFWHKKDVAATTLQWLLLVGGVPIVGGAVFLVDGVIGHLLNPTMGFVEGALNTGLFGGALTAITTAGMSAISIAGLVRSFFVSTDTRPV